jgi:hypothetical protein
MLGIDWTRLLRCAERGLRDAVVVIGESVEGRNCESATWSLAIIAPDHGPSHMAPRGALEIPLHRPDAFGGGSALGN